jgi:hypothetical protein
LSSPRFNREGGAPRSVLILVVLLVVASGALFLSQRHDPAVDLTLGGPLFPVAKENIEGLLIIAVRETDSDTWMFNPPDDLELIAGHALVFMSGPEGRKLAAERWG